ncbi:ATP-binding cassette sub-family G member 4 [Blattella germanica]|nr:ATP-binding cassette sub-family G member 4 [Blattella germanica]
MFDDLYLLSEGECLYNGPISQMTAVFQEAGFQCPQYYNRADFAVEVACNEREGSIAKLIARNVKEAEHPEENHVNERTSMLSPTLNSISMHFKGDGSRYALSVWRQTCVLFRRAVRCTIRDLHLARIRLIAHIFIGLFMGLVFYDIGDDAAKVPSNTAALMFFMMFLFFCNLFPFVHSFPSEKLVLLCPTGFLLSAYYLSAQPYDGARFIQCLATFVMLGLVAQALGLVTGALVDPQMGVFVVCVLALPMLLFSGFYLRIQDMHIAIHWLSYVSFFRHGFEAMMECVYGYNRPRLRCSEAYCHFRNPQKYLEEFGMENGTYWYDMIGLALWVIALQIILHLILHIKMRIAR